MKHLVFSILFSISLSLFSQNTFPNPLKIKTFEYLSSDKVKRNYDFSKAEKKIFLFYDIASEPMAEVMFNGCDFIFNKKKVAIFPIFYTGLLTKKSTDNIDSDIPVQVYRSVDMSPFRDFGFTEADLPFVAVYNEKNELCGISKSVQGIGDIDCGVEMVKLKVLRLKIMTEEKDKTMLPYAFKSVFVLGLNKKDTIAKLTTNKYGDFNAEIPDVEQDYLITVNEKNKDINFAILATQSGKLVGKFKSTDSGFEYKLLKVDIMKLPDIAEEVDVEMKFTVAKIKGANNFDIIETLYYELGEIDLTNGSKLLIDKVKKVLDTYPDYKLKVVSHTDSQGDDNSNLKLSLKRSETVIAYLHSLGIDSERLSAEGKGETELRNRCVNGVDCSDKEHEYNRRTEFKFYKKR